MFVPARWAAALTGSLEAGGAEIHEGITVLRVFASWAKSIPGALSGNSAAAELEKLAREAVLKTGTGSPAAETALRFIALMVRNGRFRHIDSVLNEAAKLLDKKNGVVKASLEYAFPPGAEFMSRVKEAVRQKTAAASVELDGRLNPELVGGFRLRTGDEVIDASVRFQLRQLEAALAAGISGGGSGSVHGGK